MYSIVPVILNAGEEEYRRFVMPVKNWELSHRYMSCLEMDCGCILRHWRVRLLMILKRQTATMAD